MRCARCDAELEPRTLGGLCPVCLFDAALPEEPADEAGEFHYDLIEEIARGGMGVVYRAVQHGSQRQVAIKMILVEQAATPGMMERFRAEAEAVGALDHPNILPIYETGEYERRPFYSMKFVRGGSLRERMSEFRQHPREAARLLALIARAVHHAHQRGILHRDLKPGNVLLDGDERTPYVTDFGLAKWLGRDQGMTLMPTALGTPQYMAPEQAAGASVELTTAADTYSLGVILYEALAGRAPFLADTPLETLRLAHERMPPPVRDLAPNVPRDLEVICLKCLAKEPAARYSSAAALADDLERWRADRTILARPATKPERLWRWAKRNPALAALSAALVLSVVIVAIGSTIAALRISQTRDRAVVAEKDAIEKLYASYLDQARASRLAGKRFDSLTAAAKAAQIHRSREARDATIAALALVDFRPGARWARPAARTMNVAFDTQLERYVVEEKTGEISIRRVSDQGEITRLKGPDSALAFVHGFSPDGRYLAAKFFNSATRVWDLSTSRVVAELPGQLTWTHGGAAFTADGQTLAHARPNGGVSFYRLEKNAPAAALVAEWSDAPLCHRLAFDPAGRKLAMVDVSEGARADQREGIFQIRDLKAEVPELDVRRPVGYTVVDWSPDGKLVAVGSWDHDVYIHDAATGAVKKVLRGHLGCIIDVRFSHDGALVASIAFDNTLRLWEVASGALLCAAPGSEIPIQFSSDDRRLGVTFADGTVGWLEIARPNIFRTLHPPKNLNRPWALAASSDGRLFASAGDGGIQLWDVESGAALRLPDGEAKEFARLSICFSPDSRTLFASSHLLGLSRWSLVREADQSLTIGARESLALPVDPQCLLGDVSADGKQLAVSYENRDVVSVVPLDPGSARLDLRGHPNAFQVAFSPDGRWAASSARLRGGVCVWNLSSGQVATKVEQGEDAFVAFSPDSSWLLTATGRGYQFWQVGTWERGPRIDPDTAARLPSFAAAFSPRGDLLAVQQTGDQIALYDARGAKRLATLETPRPLLLEFLRFSGNGQYLGALGADQIVQLWDIAAVRGELQARGLDWD